MLWITKEAIGDRVSGNRLCLAQCMPCVRSFWRTCVCVCVRGGGGGWGVGGG